MTSSETFVVPDRPCPACTEPWATRGDLAYKRDNPPKGFNVCLQCGAILRLDAEHAPRAASDAELLELDAETREQVLWIRSYVQRRGPSS